MERGRVRDAKNRFERLSLTCINSHRVSDIGLLGRQGCKYKRQKCRNSGRRDVRRRLRVRVRRCRVAQRHVLWQRTMDTSDSRLYPYVHNTYIIVVYYTDTDTDFWRHALKMLYICRTFILLKYRWTFSLLFYIMYSAIFTNNVERRWRHGSVGKCRHRHHQHSVVDGAARWHLVAGRCFYQESASTIAAKSQLVQRTCSCSEHVSWRCWRAGRRYNQYSLSWSRDKYIAKKDDSQWMCLEITLMWLIYVRNIYV